MWILIGQEWCHVDSDWSRVMSCGCDWSRVMSCGCDWWRVMSCGCWSVEIAVYWRCRWLVNIIAKNPIKTSIPWNNEPAPFSNPRISGPIIHFDPYQMTMTMHGADFGHFSARCYFFTLIVPQLHAEFQKNRWSGFPTLTGIVTTEELSCRIASFASSQLSLPPCISIMSDCSHLLGTLIWTPNSCWSNSTCLPLSPTMRQWCSIGTWLVEGEVMWQMIGRPSPKMRPWLSTGTWLVEGEVMWQMIGRPSPKMRPWLSTGTWLVECEVMWQMIGRPSPKMCPWCYIGTWLVECEVMWQMIGRPSPKMRPWCSIGTWLVECEVMW